MNRRWWGAKIGALTRRKTETVLRRGKCESRVIRPVCDGLTSGAETDRSAAVRSLGGGESKEEREVLIRTPSKQNKGQLRDSESSKMEASVERWTYWSEKCKLVCYSSLKGVGGGGGRGVRGGGGGVRGLVDVLIRAWGVLSRAVHPRKPLGQPVVRGPVLVVRGRAGRTSRVVWSRTGRAAVALVAMVRASRVPVGVRTAVVPLTAWVIALTVESSPVALENLRI